MRFHDLWHTAAALLLAQGVHPKVVQEMLGHSTVSLTLATYSHVIPGLQVEAAAKMDARLHQSPSRHDWGSTRTATTSERAHSSSPE